MTDYKYNEIVMNIYELKFDVLNEWEQQFIFNLYEKNDLMMLSESQKEKILEINRKYLKYN